MGGRMRGFVEGLQVLKGSAVLISDGGGEALEVVGSRRGRIGLLGRGVAKVEDKRCFQSGGLVGS